MYSVKYICVLAVSFFLISCVDTVDSGVTVKNETGHKVVFTIGSNSYELSGNDHREFPKNNSSNFVYKTDDFTQESHSRVYAERSRNGFIDHFVFNYAPETEFFIDNQTGRDIFLTSIGTFNSDDNFPQGFNGWMKIIPDELKSSSKDKLYGFITRNDGAIDPFEVSLNTRVSENTEKYGVIFPHVTQRYDRDKNRIIPVFTVDPQFIAIDRNGLRKIVDFTHIQTGENSGLYVIIR